MLITPHLIAGAALGKALKRPWLALPIAFVSHLLLDAVPHLDSNGMFGHGGLTTGVVIAAVVDTVLGVALLLWLARGNPAWRLLLAAAFMGALPDFLYHVPPWGPWFHMWPPTAWFAYVHGSVQWNVPPAAWPLGLGTQITLVVVAVWYLRWEAFHK